MPTATQPPHRDGSLIPTGAPRGQPRRVGWHDAKPLADVMGLFTFAPLGFWRVVRAAGCMRANLHGGPWPQQTYNRSMRCGAWPTIRSHTPRCTYA